MTSPLTLGRRAAWDAINSWQRLKDGNGNSVFKRQDRFESNGRGGVSPTRQQIEAGYGVGDLPALAIQSAAISMRAEVTRIHHWFFDQTISLFTPEWDLLKPEEYVAEIVNALYAATPPAVTVTFIQQATGFVPEVIPGVRFQFVLVGGDAKLPATRTDITFRVRIQFSPYEQ